MAKRLPRIKGTYSDPLAQATDGKYRVDVELKEGVGVEDGFDEEGHVIVLTQTGLAMVVAGLRSIKDESPEVIPMLEGLEDALREGFMRRMQDA